MRAFGERDGLQGVVALGVLVLATGFGCGGESRRTVSEGPDKTQAPPVEPAQPVPLDELAAAIAKTECSHFADCAAAGDPRVSDCEERDRRWAGYFAVRVELGLSRGTVVYDPAGVGACLAELGAEDCSRGFFGDLDCPGALDGLVPPGGACLDSVECAGDAFCDLDACEGHCVTRWGAGHACGSGDGECGQGTECIIDAEPVCGTYPREGHSCRDLRCAGAVACRPEDFECARPELVGEGDVCGDGFHVCAEGTVCGADPGETITEYHCVPAPVSGGHCPWSASEPCPPGEWCRHSYTDQPNWDFCVPLPVEGEACTDDRDCNSDAWGTCVDGACAKYRDLGEPCTDQVCLSGSCHEGVCTVDSCLAGG